jgi:uncharacterized membrane protein YphA (DoxX/SURF4 family)
MNSITQTATAGAYPHATASPAYQAYQALHIGFTIAPIVAGVDKFFHFLTNWNQYLAPQIASVVPASTFMLAVGVIEVIAGLLVAFVPRIGGYLACAWFLGIIGNLLLLGGYYDIALRDLGLAIGAFALARLSEEPSR